jgi:hypothetical protein
MLNLRLPGIANYPAGGLYIKTGLYYLRELSLPEAAQRHSALTAP